MPSGWASHKLKNNCITDILLQEISEHPVRLPTLGVWHEKEETPKRLVLKATGAWVQELCRTGETKTPFLEGTHKLSCVLGTRVKEYLIGGWARPLNLLGKEKLSVAHWGSRDTSGRGHRENPPAWALLEVTILASETWPHPRAYKFQCWNASGQTTNMVGTQPHPSAERLPKIVLRPQLSKHTPW